MRYLPQEHLPIAVSWNDGRTVTLDVRVAEALGDETFGRADAEATVYPIDLDVLETDGSFREFIQEATRHAAPGEVVRGVTLQAWRGKLLDRVGVTADEIPNPIPYDAEGDVAAPSP